MKKLYKNILVLFFLLMNHYVFAQNIAWQRVQTMGKGMNLSWLEGYWTGDPNNNYMDYLDLSLLPGYKDDIQLMAETGIKTLRLPVTFHHWEDGIAPYDIDRVEYFEAVDSMISWTKQNNMNIIICYHHGNLNTNNQDIERIRIGELWKQIATRYSNTNPDRVFFQIYNEPYNMDAADWQISAEYILGEIRTVTSSHTLIVGGTNWNSIQGLLQLEIFDDDNIIYDFHYYEPFVFTHQGASWVGDPVATTGIPYPYDANAMPSIDPLVIGTWGEGAFNNYMNDGNLSKITQDLQTAQNWMLTNGLPLICDEWGSFFPGGWESRCRHTSDVRNTLENLSIPYCYWEWDQGFSLFNGPPSLSNIEPCMEEAWDFSPSVVSVEGIKEYEFSLFPNPTTGQMLLEVEAFSSIKSVVIVNNLGQAIQQFPVTQKSTTWNLEDIQSGFYYIYFLNKNGIRISGTSFIKI